MLWWRCKKKHCSGYCCVIILSFSSHNATGAIYFHRFRLHKWSKLERKKITLSKYLKMNSIFTQWSAVSSCIHVYNVLWIQFSSNSYFKGLSNWVFLKLLYTSCQSSILTYPDFPRGHSTCSLQSNLCNTMNK